MLIGFFDGAQLICSELYTTTSMTICLNNINELQDMHKDENIVGRLTKFILQNDLKQSQIDEFR